MASNLISMLRDSVSEPRLTADRLLAIRPSMGIVLQGAVLVSVLDALILGILGGGTFVMATPEGDVAFSPFAHAAILLASMVLSAGALQVGGQMLGGKGRFGQALLLVVWLEVLAIAIQFVTLVTGLILPSLAGVLGFLGLAIILWCVVHFARALHGFQGYGRTIAALLLGGVIVVVGMSLILAMLGFGGPPADV